MYRALDRSIHKNAQTHYGIINWFLSISSVAKKFKIFNNMTSYTLNFKAYYDTKLNSSLYTVIWLAETKIWPIKKLGTIWNSTWAACISSQADTVIILKLFKCLNQSGMIFHGFLDQLKLFSAQMEKRETNNQMLSIINKF